MKALVENFDLSEKAALERYAAWVGSLQVEQDLYEYRKLKISSNPGFGITMTKEPFKNILNIDIENIDNFYYIDLILSYLNSLIVITQFSSELGDYKKEIRRYCFGKSEFDIDDESDVKEGIQSGIEEGLQLQKKPTFLATEMVFDEEASDDEGLLGLLEEDDDEDDDLLANADENTDVNEMVGGVTFSNESDSESLELDEDSDSPSQSIQKTSDDIDNTKNIVTRVVSDDSTTPGIGDGSLSESESLELEEDSNSPSQTIQEASQDKEQKSPSPEISESQGQDQGLSQSQSISLELDEGIDEDSKDESKSVTPSVEKTEAMQTQQQEMSSEGVLESKSKTESKPKTETPSVSFELEEEESLTPESSKTKTPSVSKSSTTTSPSVSTELTASPSTSKSIDSISSKSTAKSTSSEVSELETDIVGMPLTYKNNPFQKRLLERDPRLFIQKSPDPSKYNVYSRLCPSNVRRQPVVLTKREKDRIDRENPGSYNYALEYGSDEKHKHYYICPRFWCLKTNTSMTEEDVKAGKCGGSSKIIPHGAKKVPKDAFVYEFKANNHEHKNKDGSYKEHGPGFVKLDSHPDGLCVPCCFAKFDGKEQMRRRKLCNVGAYNKEEASKAEKVDQDDYIKSDEKMPLMSGRYGFLPISIQKFLHNDNTKCSDPTVTSKIRPFTPCLLRKGVVNNTKQSFLEAMCDIYSIYQKDRKVLPLKEFKQEIINALSLDKYITLFNGSLVDIFYQESLTTKIADFSETNLYNTLDVANDKKQRNYFKKVIDSFTHFKEYLLNDDIIIDHTYLWDIFSQQNNKLFLHGLNIIILEVQENDGTDNIGIVCPTNTFSSENYKLAKPTAMFIKKQDYYEPIYQYTNKETSIDIIKLFSVYHSNLNANIKKVLLFLRDNMNKCLPLNSRPKTYLFEKNIQLTEVKTLTKKIPSIKIVKYYMNYNSKMVGCLLDINGVVQYIPCVGKLEIEDEEAPIEIIDSYAEYNDYDTTKKALTELYRKSNGSIHSNPRLRVVEDEKVVGILTNSNQFVPVIVDDDLVLDDDLEEIQGTNYLLSDIETLTEDKYDVEREKTIKKLKLEKNFYYAFINTIKFILSDYNYLEERNQLDEILNEKYMNYVEKLKNISDIIEDLAKEHVEFSEIDEKTLLSNEIVELCKGKTSDECKSKPFCLTKNVKDSGNEGESEGKEKCILLIPEKNLISGIDNKDYYIGKIADQFIRFDKMRDYFMKPNIFLYFDKQEYLINDDEVLLLNNVLNEDYFEDNVPFIENKYLNNKDVNFVEPLQTQKYISTFNYLEMSKPKETDNCIKSVGKVKGNWGEVFGSSFKHTTYKNTVNCGFSMMISIIKEVTKKEYSIQQLKEILYGLYKNLFSQYPDKRETIIRILRDQSKQLMMTMVLQRKATFEDVFMSSQYYITNLDILLLASHFKLPLVLYTGTKNGLYEMKAFFDTYKRNKMWITMPKSDVFIFIRQSGIRRNVIPTYGVSHLNKELLVNEVNMTKKLRSQLGKYKMRPSFKKYIETYKPIIIRRELKLKPMKIVKDDAVIGEIKERKDAIIKPLLTKKKVVDKKRALKLAKKIKLKL